MMKLKSSWVNIILFTCIRYIHLYIYAELIKNGFLVQNFGQAMFQKTKADVICNHGLCHNKDVIIQGGTIFTVIRLQRIIVHWDSILNNLKKISLSLIICF